MEEKITGSASAIALLNGAVSKKEMCGESVPVYRGEYEITPKINEEVILETKSRKLTENLVIKRVPIYMVSNHAGGETLIIGDEYYGS